VSAPLGGGEEGLGFETGRRTHSTIRSHESLEVKVFDII
jgi:hypothetical protein